MSEFGTFYPVGKLITSLIKEMVLLDNWKEAKVGTFKKHFVRIVETFGVDFFKGISPKDEATFRWLMSANEYFYIPDNRLVEAFNLLKDYKEKGGFKIRAQSKTEWAEIKPIPSTSFMDFYRVEKCMFGKCKKSTKAYMGKNTRSQNDLLFYSLAFYDWKVVSSTLFSHGFKLNRKTEKFMTEVMKNNFKRKIKRVRAI